MCIRDRVIADVMEGARAAPGPAGKSRKAAKGAKGAARTREMPTTAKAMGKLLKQLEAEMLEHAKNLEFEQAAAVRDELSLMREQGLLLVGNE